MVAQENIIKIEKKLCNSLCFESLNFKINFRAINFLDHRIVRKALNYHGGATQCVKQNNEPATLSDDF